MILPNLATCTACPLHANGFVVYGSGPVPNDVMIIGEAPGSNENTTGRPFVGRSGIELDRLLALGGVDRSTAYVSNVLKHWPGENNPTPGIKMIRACIHWLMEETTIVDPSIIIAVGAISCRSLIPGVDLRRDHGIGRVCEVAGKPRTVYPMYHPAAGMHNPALKPIIQADYEGLRQGIAQPPSTIYIHGEPAQFDPKLPLAIDLETSSLDTTTCEVACVAYTQVRGTGWVSRPSVELFHKIEQFKRQGGLVVVHNAAFDLVILERFIGRITNFWDTMLSGYVLGTTLGLKSRALREHNILMTTFDQVGGGEKDSTKIPFDVLALYAVVDVDQTLQFYYEDSAEVGGRGIEAVMETEHRLMWVIQDMKNRGIVIDEAKLEELSKELAIDVDIKAQRVYELIGHEFNVDSGDQLAVELFDVKGLKHLKRTKSKKRWSVDEEVLRWLEVQYPDNPIPGAVLDYREAAKIKSTYVEGTRQWIVDGRIHPTLRQTGASTFRFSAEKPNYQNQPSRNQHWKKAIKGLFRASTGCRLVAIDYGQLELRVAASLSQDNAMIEVFANDGDIHTKTVREILKSEVDITPGGMNLRTLAKNINFGALYGLSGGGLMRYLAGTDPPIHVSLRDAVGIVNGIRDTYPGYMAWVDGVKAFVRSNGYAETLQGRRKYFPVSEDSSTEKEWVNMPVQGTAGGDIVRDAMVELGRLGFPLVVNVHDELCFDVEEELAMDVAKEAARIMIERAERILGVRVKVDVSIGDTWGDMTKVEV